ncbi:MAG TPA: TauD/TfdA family dioxygenase, partial [Stellaceae bacterium]|nr:TauD/TfdA family dioxygenase [Stellaceae bacterium]
STLRGGDGPRYRPPGEDGAPYETISVDKLTPVIGAEVGGVDLARPSNRQMDEIHRALAENSVIFFRDQQLTPEQHLDFGCRFGPLHLHPAAPHAPGHPELMIIHADKDSPRANGEGWHSDVSCDLEPPMGSILYITTCPPHGGDTMFASMYAAYDTLPEAMKAKLEPLRGVNYYDPTSDYVVRKGPPSEKALRWTHPVIRVHPATGRKALYVNRLMTFGIEGMDPAEGDALLAYLFDHQEQRQFIYRHVWRPGDVILWDNRCTLHARTDFSPDERRLLRRITVQTESA